MSFIHDDFMLQSDTAKKLYHSFAKDMPIIDYHCHLVPKMIADDYRFSSITELMLGGDHYKWAAMRSFGIDEKYITGDGGDFEKFEAFASALPYCIGNPLYHWTHLELKRYFNIDKTLCKESAKEIYDEANKLLALPEYSAKNLIARSNVEFLCTTDDPADTLEYHKQIAASGFKTKVLPTFRPDKAINIHKDTFLPYMKMLGVRSLDELKAYMAERLDFFHENGCRVSDHGLDYIPYESGNAAAAFKKALKGKKISKKEIDAYATDMLLFFGKEYAARGWCMQIHVGAQRNNNTAMFEVLGPDTGYDTIGDCAEVVAPLARIMDTLEYADALPKTILYSLNSKDNPALATLCNAFQKAPYRSRIQLGSGWWFNDQKEGMIAQLKAFANTGVLGNFVGMLTDSRSFVSFPRHEYFRRILCNLIGQWVEDGEYPCDEEMLGNIIRGICYENAKSYFEL